MYRTDLYVGDRPLGNIKWNTSIYNIIMLKNLTSFEIKSI